jgi:hypothetical protein
MTMWTRPSFPGCTHSSRARIQYSPERCWVPTWQTRPVRSTALPDDLAGTAVDILEVGDGKIFVSSLRRGDPRLHQRTAVARPARLVRDGTARHLGLLGRDRYYCLFRASRPTSPPTKARRTSSGQDV